MANDSYIQKSVSFSNAFYKKTQTWLQNSNIYTPKEKEELVEKLDFLNSKEVNVLVIGGTGVGKSSTINALFKTEEFCSPENKAKVGNGPDPETQTLSVYSLGNLKIWDTPGVGESKLADIRHVNAINKKLNETDQDGKLLIDLVLVLMDGGVRDYGSIFTLLERIKHQIKDHSRLIIGINRIDMIEKGRGWDDVKACPTPALASRISEKVESVARRIRTELHIDTKPIAFCAGYSDEFGSRDSYNIPELLCAVIAAIHEEKSVVVVAHTRTKVLHQATPEQRKTIAKKVKRSDDKAGEMLVRAGLMVATGGLIGGCFVTTAVCEYRHKPDNCHMLYSFRKFRDSWLAKQPGGSVLIGEYYDIAPGIVSWIDQRKNRDEIYDLLYKGYLEPCYRLIKKKQYENCKCRYIEMIRMLEKLKASSSY